MAYYNTTNLSGQDLSEAWEKADKQEEFIRFLFSKYYKMTASEAWHIYIKFSYNTPLTSIRRAITDLMNEGYLCKTDEKKTGVYGKPEYMYKVRGNQLSMF